MKRSVLVLAVLLVFAVSSAAFAAKGLLTGADIENGSLTGADIKKGSLGKALFAGSADSTRRGLPGPQGARGVAGSNGVDGVNGSTGSKGTDGTRGVAGGRGTDGTNGVNGNSTNGVDGTNGLAGLRGTDGTNGTSGSNGSNGTNGTNGTNGVNGTVTPRWATAGLIALPTHAPTAIFVTVVSLVVPAGRYIVLAKTQLAHSGAGDAIHCDLKADAATIDQVDMKTLPALAAVPVSLQAVATFTSDTQLSVACSVLVADGTAASSSLIAVPTS